jgi:Putative beta-barrel porin 2
VNIRGGAAAVAFLVLSSSAAAQQLPAPPSAEGEGARVRLGPLWLNPTVSLTNAGIDTNVFNDSDADHPKRDFTMTVTPRTDIWMRLGRTWLGSTIKEDVIWYKTYASERATNGSYTLGWIAPLTRVSFGAEGSLGNMRDRAGYEIDARLQHTDQSYAGSAEVRALSKTYVGVKAVRRQIDYAQDSQYRGVSVREALNRTETNVDLLVKYRLTPLTNLVVQATHGEDQFEFDPLRNSKSDRAIAGVTFDPFALIKGSARFGYERFRPVTPTIPAYDGSTAEVDLTYVASTSTKVSVQGLRDVQYSYDITQPYYLQTGGTGSLTQRIAGPFDAALRGTLQQLAYRNRTDIIAVVSDRVDRVQSYGASIGYRIGADLRVALNVDRQVRRSEVATQRYRGMRYGVSATYGL